MPFATKNLYVQSKILPELKRNTLAALCLLFCMSGADPPPAIRALPTLHPALPPHAWMDPLPHPAPTDPGHGGPGPQVTQGPGHGGPGAQVTQGPDHGGPGTQGPASYWQGTDDTCSEESYAVTGQRLC